MVPLLYDRHVFRGYETLDSFVNNENALYERTEYPNVVRNNKSKDKYIYILSKYFFEGGKKNSKQWLLFENHHSFNDCVFIYEDHEESMNIDYRWLEVMRRRKKGVYIKDSCPIYIKETINPNEFGACVPVILPGFYPVYDKWNGKPFSLYKFNDPNTSHRNFIDHSNRDIDVLFLGKNTTRRDVYIKMIKNAAVDLNIKHIISDSMVSIEEHISLLKRSKIAYQFMAIGYRSSREWEAMVNGALLISDDRTVDNINTPGMVAGKDFIRLDSLNVKKQMNYWLKNSFEREKIALSGFNSSWKIWSGCTDPYMPSRKRAGEKIKESKWTLE